MNDWIDVTERKPAQLMPVEVRGRDGRTLKPVMLDLTGFHGVGDVPWLICGVTHWRYTGQTLADLGFTDPI